MLARLAAVAAGVSLELLFVDDSDDETPEAVRAHAPALGVPFHVIHREGSARNRGLATAVVAGFAQAQGTWLCVMDADLQHPPELILSLLERAQQDDVDIVIASRFARGGGAGDFGLARRVLSNLSSGAARMGFRRALREVSDPMSGFFVVRRASIELPRLRPRGFKILLEILVRFPQLRKAEVPFVFGRRHAGTSKASAAEGLRYGLHLWRLRLGGTPERFVRFGLVGLSGLVVNTLLLAALKETAHLYYLLAAVIATQGSTLWNFLLVERLVFHRETARGGRLSRFLQFAAVNNALLFLRGPALFLMTSELHVMYLVSNVLTLVALTLARFGVADTWIWAPSKRTGPWTYDIHRLVTLRSEVALPELERFAVDELEAPPAVTVSIGPIAPESDRPREFLYMDGERFVYDEGLGAWGFAVDIVMGESASITGSRLLRHSPHVLYTNVVEPLLRWHLAERGYALVHAACVASGLRAFLITARTDTGKTTTILKTLDRNPGLSFLSDDLTLLTPEGDVLTYPKPLTISRHTAQAVQRSLLNWKERLGLVLQSRVHSKSGRSFAFFLSRHHLPVATINALVQLLVPPPKYHVERLVPGVRRLDHAAYDQLVVIQRGEDDRRLLDPREAVAIVLENCADAYGFPPYSHLERFLQERSAVDLAEVERALISRVVESHPATLLSSKSRSWYQALPEILGIPAVAEPRSLEVDLADQVVLSLPAAPRLDPEVGTTD